MKEGYKQTEIGVIPEDWEAKQIGSFARICMCKRVFADQTAEVGDIPFYKIGTFGGKPDAYISRALYSEYKNKYSYPENGDVLISAAGTLGRTVVFDGADSYFQDSNIVWLDIDKTQICNEYLKHYYEVIQWAASEGSTISRLYNGIIERTYVSVPPLAEQQRIAEALSDMDELIASLEKLIAKKKAIKQGAMQELLTGKRRLPGFTGEWREYTVEDVAVFCTASIPTSWINLRHYIGTDNMLANRNGIRDNTIAIPYVVVREYREGDILLSNIRPYLKKIWLADKAGGCSNDVFVIRSINNEKVLPTFLFYLLSQDAFFDEVMASSVGTKMPRGDKNIIKNYRITVPSDSSEQQSIVSILSSMDYETKKLKEKLEKTRQIKQGMMQQLLTGKTRFIN